ncbi:MAG: glycosyltransferase family 2 protein [Cyclobacteriaceae bacterium]|nr:glycosyltransferase family 2 protein [Cyclobacteriaceae bacterium]
MTISGYTFVRNATKLAYPLKESILSILDLVDEFVIAFIEGDIDDNTLEVIQSIKTNKIKIIEATWEPERFKQNTLYSYLSDVAKNECTGDWLFYLQVDEVVHEKYLPIIKKACEKYLPNTKIEGLLFHYRHFWGDYNHCFTHHGWYPSEIRIIRNLPEIHSWRDAQSFRFYSQFEATTDFYQSKKFARKLYVAQIPTEIYHYGWVRPPFTMSTKQDRMVKTWDSSKREVKIVDYDYGPLNKVPKFTENHPRVMQERIKKLDWEKDLQYSGKILEGRALYKHEKLKYRIRSWIELNLLGGREIGGFKNYKIVAKFK